MQELLHHVLPAPTKFTFAFTVLLIACAALLRRRAKSERSRRDIRGGQSHSRPHSPSNGSQVTDDEEELDPGRRTTIHGTLIPSTGLVIANPPEPCAFENAFCKGLVLPMHKPTMNPELVSSGAYLYGDHFTGRKRLWEFRMQFQFKQPVQGSLMIGVELDSYVPLNAAAKRLMGMTVAALRQVVGNDMYHTVGDDPATTPAPHERPVFMMPLWAFDQVIVTPEGESPPDLSDPDFSKYGTLRADDRQAFVRELSALNLGPGPTFTFAVWGISQFLDCITWQLTKIVPFKPIDFNLFCGAPPVHVVLYTLDLTGAPEGDTRHLQSRKNYYLHYALWSPFHKPSKAKIRELIPCDGDLGCRSRQAKPSSKTGLFRRALGGCCASERSY